MNKAGPEQILKVLIEVWCDQQHLTPEQITVAKGEQNEVYR